MQSEVNTPPDSGPSGNVRTYAPDLPPTPPQPAHRRLRRDLPLLLVHLLIIAGGCALIVVTAVRQPYNENELAQVDAYSHAEWEAAISGTRQPPLQPAVGVAVQRLVGVGQIAQRIESIAAGVGTLAVLAALFWRLGTPAAGAVALGIVATSPLLLRYSAYARPYAVPVFLMVLCGYLLVRWLELGRWFHLLGVAVAAAALPLARVPEPMVFLATTVLALVVLGWRGRHPWPRVLPAVAAVCLALVAVGYPMYRQLSASTSGFAQANPLRVLLNAGPQLQGLVTTLPKVLAEAFPWWPLILGVVLVATAAPVARAWLVRSWLGLVLLVPPLAWAVYYHLAIQAPGRGREGLVYQPRFAYFFVPFLAFAFAAVASTAFDRTSTRWVTAGLAALLVAVFVGQLPTTARVLSEPQAADWAAAATMIAELPDDAVVLYDNIVPTGSFRQGFHARPRYLSSHERVVPARYAARTAPNVPEGRPLYVLLLAPDQRRQRCTDAIGPIAAPPDGWRLRERQHRFSMYEPVAGAESADIAEAFIDFGHATPPQCGYAMIAAGASLLHRRADDARARQLLDDVVDDAPRDAASQIRRMYDQWLPAPAPGLLDPPALRSPSTRFARRIEATKGRS